MAGTEPRGISGELRVLQRLSEYEFGVELWVMREGPNSNNWDYRNIETYYRTFLGTPILCAFIGSKVGDGHNMTERRNPKTGEGYYSFTDGTAERIVGAISEDPNDLTIREEDGYKWLIAKGRLFAFYAPELVDKIVRTGRMSVSAETEVKVSEKQEDREVFTEWSGLGVTILGDDVPPAIPGARIAALAAMQDEFKSLKLKAASLQSKPEQKPREQKINKGVKIHMNKQTLARLAPKFPDHRIVGLSENGMCVGLVNSKGEAYSYVFNSEDNGKVFPERIVPAKLSLSFDFGEDGTVGADMGDVVEHVITNCRETDGEVKAIQERLDTALDTIKRMNDAEHNRRIQAIKNALKATLAEIRENDEDEGKEAEEDEKEIEENAEAYSEMEDNCGFNGDKAACRELMARTMEKRLESNRAKRKNSFTWKDKDGNGSDGDGITAMLARITG